MVHRQRLQLLPGQVRGGNVHHAVRYSLSGGGGRGSAAAYRAVSECRKGQRSGVCIPLRHDQRGAAVYDLVAKLEGVSTVSLCANAASTLNDACDLSLCVPWAFDESVCQTRTIGSFFAALAMICALVSRDTRLQEQLKAVSRMGGALDERVLPLARQLAEKDWDHVVVLADAEAAGVMEEGALAFKEICCLNSNFYNLLDVRHGPVVMIDERTFVFAFLESAGQTEQALLEDLRKRTGYVVSLGPFAAAEGEDTHFDTGEITDPVAAAIPALYLLQNVALYKALKRGVDPDRPNGLSAWIRL